MTESVLHVDMTIIGEILNQGAKSWALASYISDELGQVLAEAEGVLASVSKIPRDRLDAR